MLKLSILAFLPSDAGSSPPDLLVFVILAAAEEYQDYLERKGDTSSSEKNSRSV
jgi:hypothetical protein